MANIIDRAKAHYREKLDEVRTVEVPEWGDDNGPLKVYVKPANLKQRDKIYRFASADSLEALVETLIQRARDEDGFPLFVDSDREDLMVHADPRVIQRVANEINEDLDDDGTDEVKEAKGN